MDKLLKERSPQAIAYELIATIYTELCTKPTG